jgi:Fe-coproporphyrin III synthase
MIGFTKLLCDTDLASDVLRYARRSDKLPSHLLQFSKDKKPVVVWNFTRTCNLHCVHCYSHSKDMLYEGELTTEEGKELIKDLASFKAPVLLFSGGEPLTRKDLTYLASYAVDNGIRAVISTNGTLITKELANELKKINLSYVGISLDGLEPVNDKFRGLKGAYAMTMKGIRNCQDAGIKVGLRFTINKRNYTEIPGIFDLIDEMNIPRICFYHLVYSGRGSSLIDEDLSHEQTREVIDLITAKTLEFQERGIVKEILTVDNHADGVYLYLQMLKKNPERAKEIFRLLEMNGGNSSGLGLACIDNIGNVHPDQFWSQVVFGNVMERKFSEIWEDTKSNELLRKLKEKKKWVTGRCHLCKYLDLCAGGFRARAEAVTGDQWASDPACFLTDEEIGINK